MINAYNFNNDKQIINNNKKINKIKLFTNKLFFIIKN